MKLFIAAVLIILGIYLTTLYFQREYTEEEPAIEFSLNRALYANIPYRSRRHTVVSNGPECASIGM